MPQAKIHCHAHDVENSRAHSVSRATSGRPTFVRDVMASHRHSFVVFICFYLLTLVNCITNLTKLLNDEVITSPFEKIPLIPCCPEDYPLYHIGLDICSESTTNSSLPLFSVLYSKVTNRQVKADDVFSFAEYNSTECPDGFVSNSTTDFRLFEDGSLSISDQRKLKTNEFCISEMDSVNSAEKLPVFVARFCVPDPCVIGPCIRKCCPPGSAILDRPEMAPMCQPHPIPFNVSQLNFQNSTSASFSVHGGFGSKCYGREDGINAFNPLDPTKFFIMADGRMFSTDYPSTPIDDRMTNEYCVDQSIQENETV